MDLHTITNIQRPRRAEEIKSWADGHAWLAGGTWLFSEPQPQTDTLIDIQGFNWEPLQITDDGLEIAATCRVVELDSFSAPASWLAAPLIPRCCRSFLASFKIWNEATVGGNLVMSLPAGPMISLTAALEGLCTLWSRDGSTRCVPVVEFVTGNQQNLLQPGELVRSIFLPHSAMKKRFAFRRFTLTHLGRSETLLIGTCDPDDDEILLTVTASTVRPVQLRFSIDTPTTRIHAALDAAIPDEMYLDDTHGSPRHRKHLTYLFAEQICAELSE